MSTVKRLSIFLSVLLCVLVFPVYSYAYEENDAETKALMQSTGLPSYYDSRELGLVPPVRNQGNSESCWAFSVIAAMEIDAVKQGLATADDVDFSEAHLVWYTFTPSDETDAAIGGEVYTTTDSPYLTRGNWQRATGTLAHLSGTVNEDEYPFDGTAEGLNTMGNYAEESRYVSDGIILDETAVLPTEADVKNWLMNHGSCTAMMYYSTKYENADTASYYYFGSSSNLNHMVTIVGWDDAYPASAFKSDPEQDGAWIVRDSRGADSHNGGYFYLSYADTAFSTFAGYTVRSSEGFDSAYTYNAVGLGPCFRHSNGVSVANVFCADEVEALTALSFYTVDEDTSADIAIYLSPELSGGDPATGELIFSDSAVFHYAGYHTLDLPQDIGLSPGAVFSVVITYSAPGGTVTVPVEYGSGIYNGCNYVNADGQSYCYLFDKTDDWCDSQDLGLGNFYINAYTSASDPDCTYTQLISVLNELVEFIRALITIMPQIVIFE